MLNRLFIMVNALFTVRYDLAALSFYCRSSAVWLPEAHDHQGFRHQISLLGLEIFLDGILFLTVAQLFPLYNKGIIV